jgi:hypothetical protein
MHAFVVGPQLQVIKPFAKHLALQRGAINGLQRHPDDWMFFGPSLKLPQEAYERSALCRRQRIRRHALGGQPLAQQLGKLLIVEVRETRRNSRPHLAPIPVRTMAAPAPALERRLRSRSSLRRRLSLRRHSSLRNGSTPAALRRQTQPEDNQHAKRRERRRERPNRPPTATRSAHHPRHPAGAHHPHRRVAAHDPPHNAGLPSRLRPIPSVRQ